MKNQIIIKSIYLFIIILFSYQNLWSQNPVNIIQSNKLEQIIINDTIFQKLSGDVIIEYTEFTIQCDTMLFDEYKENLIGWGNINVVNTELKCSSDAINIHKLDSTISFLNNTVIELDNLVIYSDNAKYSYNNNILSYNQGGYVKNNEMQIESEKLTYNNKSKVANFNNQVKLFNETYKLYTENLKKNNQLINFSGTTIIYQDDLVIKCKKGDLEQFISFNLFTDVEVETDSLLIKSNKLFIDLKKNTSYFSNNVDVKINDKTHLYGDNFYQIDSISTMTNNSFIELINSSDTLKIYGDTLTINQDKEELKILNNVIIYGNQLEGSCKRMHFYSNYKDIYMHDQPVLWFKDTQITGELIELYTRENNLDSIYITKNPFILSPIDSLTYFNQISGNTLNGKFKNQTIHYINVYGNSQVKYFERIKSKSSININDVQSGNIQIIFNNNNNIKELMCYDQIESNCIEVDITKPILSEKLLYLDGFIKKNRLTLYKNLNISN